METKEINRLLFDEKDYIGTFARDLLPSRLPLRRKVGLIVNTDTHDSPGEHWIAIYLDGNGGGEYFDSYGLPPLHKEFIYFMQKNCPIGWCWNSVTLQCLTCITCGQYCLTYIKLKLNNYSLCDYISLFTFNRNKNDLIIKNLVKILFPKAIKNV